VRSLGHEVSFRLPVYGFKGGHDGSHHGGGALSGYAGICIGDPEVGDMTISEMSPEEIRAELKRCAICIKIYFYQNYNSTD
jgi:hypothetical protein